MKRVRSKRVLKILGYSAVVFLILLLLVAGVIQTPWFKGWLKDFAVNTVNRALGAELSIGQIEGNLFSEIIISDIFLERKQDTLVYIPAIMAKYSLTGLFSGTISVDSIVIDRPYLHPIQYPDSSWNFSGIVRTDSPRAADQESKDSFSPGIDVYLNRFRLHQGTIDIIANDTIFPTKIQDINILFAGSYTARRQEFNLQAFRFSSKDPDFTLDNMSFKLDRNLQQTSLKDFVLSSHLNRIEAAGNYRDGHSPMIQGVATTAPLQLNEFHFILPDIALAINPSLSVNGSFKNDSLRIEANLRWQDQQIALQASLSDFPDNGPNSTLDKMGYSLTGQFKDVRVAEWLGDENLDYLLSGTVRLTGKRLSPAEAEADLAADLSECQIFAHPVDRLVLDAHLENGQVRAQVFAEGVMGEVWMSGEISDITDQQIYDVFIQTDHLNLAVLTNMEVLQSDLNLRLKATGRTLDIHQIRSNIQFNISPSWIAGIPIDTVFSDMALNGLRFSVDTLHLQSGLGQLDLSGEVSPQSYSHFGYILSPRNLNLFRPWTGLDSLRVKGQLSGEVKGTPDSLQLWSDLQLGQVSYQEYQADSIIGFISLVGKLDSLTGNGDLRVVKPELADFKLDALAIEASFAQNWADIFLSITGKGNLKTTLRTLVEKDSTLRFTIPQVALDFEQQQWRGGSDDMRLVVDGTTLQFENLLLQGTPSVTGPVQEVYVNGKFSLDQTESLFVRIDQINIEEWTTALGLNLPLKGLISLNTELSGTAMAPVVSGQFSLREGMVNQWSYYGISGSFGYQDERFSWDLAIKPTAIDSLKLEGFLPVVLSLIDPSKNQVLSDTVFSVSLRAPQLPLSLISAMGVKTQEIKGYLNCDIHMGGTLRQPRSKGYLNMENGVFIAPTYGVDLQKINLDVQIEPQMVTLRKFQAVREKGSLSATGKIEFTRDKNSIAVKHIRIDMLASQFSLIKDPKRELQVDGNLSLSGDLTALKYSGKFTVPRANVVLPSLIGNGAAAEDLREPLLVLERQKQVQKSDTLSARKGIKTAGSSSLDSLTFLKNLSGNLIVTASRNTWIRQTNMAIELAYELEIFQKGIVPEVVGRVDLVRGYYNLLGRRFTFQDSHLYFDGGSELNPRLEINIEYELRTASRDKKSMEIRLRDYAKTPKITFMLDNKVIEQSEAFSYLIYGKSQQELSAGEQSDLNSSTNILASYLSNQLGSTVGSKIGVDVLEVNSQDNWESASVSVGKYIATDVFVRYEQRFGEDTQEDIAKQLVTLEYEFSRAILLQLVGGSAKYSGFDLIFRFQKE